MLKNLKNNSEKLKSCFLHGLTFVEHEDDFFVIYYSVVYERLCSYSWPPPPNCCSMATMEGSPTHETENTE